MHEFNTHNGFQRRVHARKYRALPLVLIIIIIIIIMWDLYRLT
jgi:hypothetical protein